MPLPVNLRVAHVTLASSVVAEILPRNVERLYLMIQNTGGTNPVSLGIDATVLAGTGVSLDPATVQNGQGGSYEWTRTVPTNPIYGFSAGGTTVVIVEG